MAILGIVCNLGRISKTGILYTLTALMYHHPQ